MDTTVIVALPSADDKVNRISSEKGAHLTLCFLGPTADLDLETIVQFVQHAASQLSPFGLEVDYRGTLGPDDADVLFFKKDSWSFPRIKDFRGHLLNNEAIEKAYLSQQQYPEWTPHLTLGYPATPAHEDTSDYPGINYVQFDRIAVWTSNDEGPEFRLKYEENTAAEMGTAAWSDMTTAEKGAAAAAELFHHGVKGMKWGVRKKDQVRMDKGHEGEAATKGQIKRADRKFLNNYKNTEKFLEVSRKIHEDSLKESNAKIDELNKSEKYKGLDLTKESELRGQYKNDVLKIANEALKNSADRYGTNASGTRQWAAWYDKSGELLYAMPFVKDGKTYIGYDPNKVEHAMSDGVVRLTVEEDELGHITNLSISEDELKHYGVKGMRWGVTTKDRAHMRAPQPVEVKQKKPGDFAKSTGGQNHPLHEEAKTSLEIRQKAKASKTDALSNTELRTAIQRMQLEQQFTQLERSSDRRSAGKKFVDGLLGNKRYGKKVVFNDPNEQAGEQVAKAIKAELAKKAAKTAVGA